MNCLNPAGLSVPVSTIDYDNLFWNSCIRTVYILNSFDVWYLSNDLNSATLSPLFSIFATVLAETAFFIFYRYTQYLLLGEL